MEQLREDIEEDLFDTEPPNETRTGFFDDESEMVCINTVVEEDDREKTFLQNVRAILDDDLVRLVILGALAVLLWKFGR